MKKIKIIITFLLFLPLLVSAAVTIDNPIGYGDFGVLVTALLDFVVRVGVALAPIFYIIAGFYYLTAGADPENVNKAKRIFIWTTIGLAIILVAGGVSSLIKNILSVTP